MTRVYRVHAATPEFVKATHGLTMKHILALWRLDILGYAPVYCTSRGTYRVLGRTLAYQAIREEGFVWDAEFSDWYQDRTR